MLLPVLYMQNTHFIFMQSFVSLSALYMQNTQFTLTQSFVSLPALYMQNCLLSCSLLCHYQHCTRKTAYFHAVFCVATSTVHAKLLTFMQSFVSLPALYTQNCLLSCSLLCCYQHCTCKTLTSLSGSVLCLFTSNTEA